LSVTIGTKLGPYEITALLGKGGMGEVYRARDTKLKRDVAIKILPDEFSLDPDRVRRFQREAEALAALNHPNIATIYDLQEANDTRFLVLELVDGETLADRIQRGPIPVDEALVIGTHICAALEAAHEKSVVHRDLKPENVMLVGHGRVKVLDFGLAKQTTIGEEQETLTLESLSAVGTVMGTPQYLSPEVLRGSKADTRSDLWAFGVVLHQMLTGRLPFTGATMFELSSSILKEPAPALPATVPARLRAVVERCLQKSPAGRFQSASELHRALQALQAHAVSRRSWIWAAGVAAVLAVGFFLWQQQPKSADGRRLSTGARASPIQEANELFELARNFQSVQNDIPKAQSILERAIVIDPHFAAALENHALLYVILLLNGYTNDRSVLYKAEEELRLAAKEDPNLLTLPRSQAAVYMAQGRKELIPFEQMNRDSNINLEIWRMIVDIFTGRAAQAQVRGTNILERDPLVGAPRMFLGDTLRTQGDIPGAIRELQKVLEQAPGNITAIRFLALAYMDTGDLQAARTLLEEKMPQFAQNYMWREVWALLLAVEGKRDEALQAMDAETQKFVSAAFVATLDGAEFYAVMNDSAKAVEWLERAVSNGDERVDWFRKNPRLSSIQKDERFLRIIDSIEARRKK
jgi:serine/threonine protein kinase